jgi:hypothetical protein
MPRDCGRRRSLVLFRILKPVKALHVFIRLSTEACKLILLKFAATGNLLEGMKRDPKAKPAMKPEMVSMNIWVSRSFRDAVAEMARKESRDVSKLVRMLLRERYPDLPEE